MKSPILLRKDMKPCQTKVFNEVQFQVEEKVWFTHICMKNFPCEQKCADNFEESVKEVIFNTMADIHM